MIPLSIIAFNFCLFGIKIFISCSQYNIQNIFYFCWCLEVYEFEDIHDCSVKDDETNDSIVESELLLQYIEEHKKNPVQNFDFYVFKA